MSSIYNGSSDISELLILSSDDRTNSDIRSMSLNVDYIVPDLRDYISVLVDFRDDIFHSFVTINKGIQCLMILITRLSSLSNE